MNKELIYRIRLEGMIAENKQREISGHSLAYVEEDFERLAKELEGAMGIPAPYGLCPICKSYGKTRERRINGNDTCVNGHTYPSKEAL